MMRLYLPCVTEAADASGGVSILVGQRCPALRAAGEAPRTTFTVAEWVPCEDVSVAEEQVECLERVLPFGVEVIGVCGTAQDVREMAAQLPSSTAAELVGLVRSGSGKSWAAHVLGQPSKAVETVVAKDGTATFVETRLALHSCEADLPLLLSVSGETPAVVDGESDVPLSSAAPLVTSGAHIVQLGVASNLLQIHLVLAPAYVSAKGMYETVRHQINAARDAGTTRLVEVQSYNAHISYCCRVEPPASSSVAELSTKALEEVFEMIEDATGTAGKHTEVRGSSALESLPSRKEAAIAPSERAPPAAAAAAEGVAEKKKAGSDFVLLVLGVAVVLIGVLIVFMR